MASKHETLINIQVLLQSNWEHLNRVIVSGDTENDRFSVSRRKVQEYSVNNITLPLILDSAASHPDAKTNVMFIHYNELDTGKSEKTAEEMYREFMVEKYKRAVAGLKHKFAIKCRDKTTRGYEREQPGLQEATDSESG